MYEGYFTLSGVELINNERTAAYARNLGITTIDCPPCTIAAAVGDNPYTTPAADEAPWYDPAAPESAGFAGFFALDVKGYESSTITRAPMERLSDGAVITRSRFNHREVQYTGVMLAADQCSLSYGLAWLSTALRGSTCSPCGGTNACAYTCCPDPTTEEQALRTMNQVGVIAGPITNRKSPLRGSRCGSDGSRAIIAEVTFTLAFGRPWLFRAPIPIIAPTLLRNLQIPPLACQGTWDDVCADVASWTALTTEYATWADLHECEVQWNGPAECTTSTDQFGCPDAIDCTKDPLRPDGCPEPPSPPRPPRPYDPCGVCYDGPNTMTGSVNVPPSVTPAWLDSVPLIEITTGTQPARALLLRFYANPTGDESFCERHQLDPCTACATIAIPYIPPGATLTIDGREQTAALDCDGGRGTAILDDSLGIFGPNGQPYGWPVFDCNGFCVSLTVPCDFPIDEVNVSLSVVAREDAA